MPPPNRLFITLMGYSASLSCSTPGNARHMCTCSISFLRVSMRGFVLSTGARDMRLPFRVPAAQQPLGHVAELRPIELACNRQHGVIRPIMLLFERKQRFTADGCNLVVRTENRTSQRCSPK